MQPRRLERLVVIGAGAVGGSIGALAHGTGFPVVLVARGRHGEALRRDGLDLVLPEGRRRLAVPCVARADEVDWRAGDVALLATKLHDAERALDALRATAGDVPVACATNGVHGERFAAARFPVVLSTMVWMPATHLVAGEVRLHAGEPRGVLDTGSHRAGADGDLAAALCELFRAAGFDALPRADIARWKHAKWITNLGNAAQALVEDDWRAVAKAARAEGEAVLAAAGRERVPTDELLARVASVRELPVEGRARAGGSTWQSRARGRPLETPFLEGALAERAREVGVPAPVNALLARAALDPRRLRAADVLAARR